MFLRSFVIFFVLIFNASIRSLACPAFADPPPESQIQTQNNPVEINLEEDFRVYLLGELANLGFVMPADKRDLRNVYFALVRVIKRRLDPVPYDIFISQQLQKKLGGSFVNQSSPLSSSDLNGVNAIIAKAIKGEDLTPHLSRKIKDPMYVDVLFYDWNIYHMHLGTTVESDGFVQRSGNLLYVAFTNANQMVLIDVLGHDAKDGFCNRDLLEILHVNWPQIMKPYLINLGLNFPSHTNADIQQYREVGISTFYTMNDGTVYGPPGSMLFQRPYRGATFADERQWRFNISELQVFSRRVKSDPDSIRKIIEETTGRHLDKLIIRLRIEDRQFVYFEVQTGVVFSH